MASQSQFGLFLTRRFGPFFATQALGALNDNIFRNALAALVVFQLGRSGGLNIDQIVNLAAMLFILPFFLFSAIVGQFADRFEKARMIRGIKLFEVMICLIAGVGLYLDSLIILLGVIFLLGFQSTLFGPIKYAILPQLLDRGELTGGNGLTAAGTFIAILAGTILGPLLTGIPTDWPYWVLAVMLVVAGSGYLAALFIPPVGIAAPDLRIAWNPVSATWRNLRHLGGNRTVFNAVLGVSWFWFFGSVFLVQIPSYTESVLGGNERVLAALLALFILGISLGAVLCEKLSQRRVEIGLVPLGAAGLTLFGADLYFASQIESVAAGSGIRDVLAITGVWRVILDLFMLGVAGGLYIVPLYALIQSEAEPAHRARVIAGMNILNALLMVAAAVTAMVVLGAVGFTIPELFLMVALLNLAVAIYIFTLVPLFALRFLMWVLTRLMYRVRATGVQQIPETGPALVVCNHVSFMDPLLIGGSVYRPIRFVMARRIHDTFGLRWLFRLARAIPIAPAKEDPECLERAYAAVDAALANGEIVGIFPEGRLSPDGEINHFRTGVEQILRKRPVPVVVMALEGLWGGLFSRHPKRLTRPGRGGFSRVQLAVQAPLAPAEVDAAGLELRVRELHDRLLLRRRRERDSD